jgi:LysR family transcriptional regulator of beta-lactamase
MDRQDIPLNALRAFEASARHLSFTRAANELCVTQAAISHQVKSLEDRLNVVLFRRLPRGLALSDEGAALLPGLSESFERIANMLGQFEGGHAREVLNLGVVGTFAVGWLLRRLQLFREAHPFIDLRLSTHNNRVDIAADGLDYAIRFGDGAWHATEAVPLLEAPLTVLCAPEIARRLSTPRDLHHEVLLRSYRGTEWPDWFRAAGLSPPPIRGPVFDASGTMVEAAMLGMGVALAPAAMFHRHLVAGRVRQPFDVSISTGRYWLTWLKSKIPTTAMLSFRGWIETMMDGDTQG